MSIGYVHYDLQHGFIHNWLVAGPQATSSRNLQRFPGQDFKWQVARHYYDAEPGISGSPIERGPLDTGTFRVKGDTGVWSYVRCREDHFVDHTAYYPTCQYLRSWAYSQIVSEAPRQVTLALASHGPADLWLNGQHIHRQEHFQDPFSHSSQIEVALQEGANEILVRFEQVAVRECPYAMALRINPADGLRVRLPTAIVQLARRSVLEPVFEAAYLDRDVFARDEQIVLHWPGEMNVKAETSVRLQTLAGRIYAECHAQGQAGDRAILPSSYTIPEGSYRLTLMPRPQEYYEDNVRIKRDLSLWAAGNHGYSEVPYGSYEERRQEALTAAAQRESGVFAEIAKMALGGWSAVNTAALRQAIREINRRSDGSALQLLGLLGMLGRLGDKPGFPASLRKPLETCILGFRYWHDEPGQDTMDYTGESQRVLFHTCEVLAGQLYPDRTFKNSGQTGRWHRAQGERLTLVWLHERGATGFADWDSNCDFAADLVALAHLADLAESEPVYEMATVIMDKLLLTIALNSYKGAFGSTHGRSSAPFILGALLEPTAGITRLLWGMGIFNHHIEGPVSLACMENYEFPPLIAEIAASSLEEMWSRERHATGAGDEKREINKVTYRTPDYMLSSAQDYRPGQEGGQEHIWQATLGPTAAVFANHPACASTGDVCRPNFWLGNRLLPRVAQWQDMLIAIYNLPEDDWLGFTHAYFPGYAFDEYALRDGWAFARKGRGYLALTAAQGLSFITEGHSAYRELRSYGRHNVWLCQMGRVALDGDFAHFQEKVLALPVTFAGLSASYTTLRGEALSFAWEGPLLRNGQEQPLAGFKHYENPYCVADLPATQMEVRSENYLLRLDLALGPVAE